MKKSTLLLLVLTIVCILSLASCGKKTNNTTNTTAGTTSSVKPTEKTESTETPVNTGNPVTTDEPIITADPTGTAQTAEPTLEPTDSTVEPTTVPTTEPTKEPTKEPTTTPTEAPTPTAVAKPTADPAIYPDDFGENEGPIRTDGKIFFWKNSRVIYSIPDSAPETKKWTVIFHDEENDQLIFQVGKTLDTLNYYAIVEGEFYKLSEGKIVSWSMHSGKNQLWWIEDNGIAKSVNVRSNKYNDVYLDAENVKGFVDVDPPRYLTFNGEIISPIAENLLVEVKKIG